MRDIFQLDASVLQSNLHQFLSFRWCFKYNLHHLQLSHLLNYPLVKWCRMFQIKLVVSQMEVPCCVVTKVHFVGNLMSEETFLGSWDLISGKFEGCKCKVDCMVAAAFAPWWVCNHIHSTSNQVLKMKQNHTMKQNHNETKWNETTTMKQNHTKHVYFSFFNPLKATSELEIKSLEWVHGSELCGGKLAMGQNQYHSTVPCVAMINFIMPISTISNTSNTKDLVWPHFQTLHRELKIWHIT